MFSYGRSNFTWNGTLRELATSFPPSCKERARPGMTASASSTGLEVLLSNLQNIGDIESTLNILNVLDELLSAGTDRRIHYMISKGGSEALLTAMVNSARSFNPNYTLLLPLLHLLAKVGHRDRRIGVKAQNADAVRLTLSLLRQNTKHPRRAAACLFVLQVYCSSVSTANLLGECRAIDVVYRFICPYTTKHLQCIKAAIDALAALLCTKANVQSAVSRGYVSGLLRFYEDWSSKDAEHVALAIRCALLRCLHELTNSTAGRHAFVTHGGMGLLYQVTQTCLFTKGLESLVDPSVQLMRKCYPKTALPMKSDVSVYCFELPRNSGSAPVVPEPELNSEEDSEEEDEEDDDNESEDADSKDYDDDLETDVDKLRTRPEPDRPPELLAQYSRLRPELVYEFQELDSSSSEPEESSSSDEEVPQSSAEDASRLKPCDFNSCPTFRTKGRDASLSPPCDVLFRGGHGTREQKEEERAEEARHHRTMVDTLAESHVGGACIPHHDRKLYRAAAVLAKSIPGFSILAFPDFWGHLPPPGNEPMAPRKPKVQRQKVFEDIQRLLNPDDIINQVVFDLEDPSPQCSSERSNSLKFFSKFECGNLRKAIQVRRHEYDLILNADANCSQHAQWFYFEVSNMVANVPYRFNVINCEKGNSQFNYGMQPVLYSVREALEGRPHWKRTGTEICYYRNHFCAARGKKRPTFYTLTFTVTFRHADDVCYLAYHYPYTYSALQSHLMVLQRSVDPSKVFFRRQVLCQTLSGNPCPLLTITACPATRGMRDLHQFRSRPCIVLTARVHPGESNASWVMKGTLEFLCSDDPVAQSLREAFVFKIIPMLNPDGVINGTHRCSLSGEDLNRQWCKPDPVLSPTIYHTKGFLYYLNSTGCTPLVFCDYHGHSRKKNVFLYGCSVKETLWQSGSDTVGLKEDPGYRTIPKTLDRLAPAFSFNSCNYQVEKSRSATARVVVWREIGVLRSYTMESTYNGCDQGIYKGLQTGTRELQEMGVMFCHSLLSVRRNVPSLYSSRWLNHNNNVHDHNSHNCFEDDEPPCVEEIEYSTDGFPKLQASDLDSDVNGNTSSGTEDEEDEEEVVHKGFNHIRRCDGQSPQSSLRSRLFPQLIGHDLEVIEVLHMKRRNSCNGVSITGRQYLS